MAGRGTRHLSCPPAVADGTPHAGPDAADRVNPGERAETLPELRAGAVLIRGVLTVENGRMYYCWMVGASRVLHLLCAERICMWR